MILNRGRSEQGAMRLVDEERGREAQTVHKAEKTYTARRKQFTLSFRPSVRVRRGRRAGNGGAMREGRATPNVNTVAADQRLGTEHPGVAPDCNKQTLQLLCLRAERDAFAGSASKHARSADAQDEGYSRAEADGARKSKDTTAGREEQVVSWREGKSDDHSIQKGARRGRMGSERRGEEWSAEVDQANWLRQLHATRHPVR
eukprot:2961168-Pleurochrysis_carterae.AAC.5